MLFNADSRVNLLVVGNKIKATSQKSSTFKIHKVVFDYFTTNYSNMSPHLVMVILQIKSIYFLPGACGFHRNDPSVQCI